jgi:hypothetical protein
VVTSRVVDEKQLRQVWPPLPARHTKHHFSNLSHLALYLPSSRLTPWAPAARGTAACTPCASRRRLQHEAAPGSSLQRVYPAWAEGRDSKVATGSWRASALLAAPAQQALHASTTHQQRRWLGVCVRGWGATSPDSVSTSSSLRGIILSSSNWIHWPSSWCGQGRRGLVCQHACASVPWEAPGQQRRAADAVAARQLLPGLPAQAGATGCMSSQVAPAAPARPPASPMKRSAPSRRCAPCASARR